MNLPAPKKPAAEEGPTSLRGKLLNATPIVMTVVATVLAGLSSGEMTTAQYDLSLATQLQSKAGDQWNFYQGKKLRGALQSNSLDLLGGAAGARPLDPTALAAALASAPVDPELETPAAKQILAELTAGELPKSGPSLAVDPGVQAAVDALDASRPDSELASLLRPVSDVALAGALRDAQAQALAFDSAIKSASQVIDTAEKQLARPDADAALRRDFVATRISFNARRYDTEAQLNQTVADLYELQVRRSNLSAERHRRRSQMFFYGMLAAQMGVVIATLALTHRKRNLLLSFAAAAGAAAVSFGLYVYLGM